MNFPVVWKINAVGIAAKLMLSPAFEVFFTKSIRQNLGLSKHVGEGVHVRIVR